MSPRLPEPLGDEHGAVLVFFALFLPVAILFLALVVDGGYAYLHQRHLQLQADAAALGAAAGFQPCSDTTIDSLATRYGGVNASSYNQQVGSATGIGAAGSIHQLINSPTFYGQSSPVDTTVNTADPCSAMMVDVKMTETGMPWWFGGINGLIGQVPHINAQARVSILQADTATGILPMAVNDEAPRYAEAYFIDESTGAQMTSASLTQTGTSGGLAVWSSAANPTTLTVPGATAGADGDVGVRIALSSTPLSGTMSSDCSAAGVLCYDASSSAGAMLDIHGYSTTIAGSATSPVARSVVLGPGTCSDAYFSLSGCTATLTAQLDMGANPSPDPSTDTFTASVAGTSSPLSCAYSSDTQLVTCTGGIPVAAGSGREQVDITYSIHKNKKKYTGTLSDVQSLYAGLLNGNSGPIENLTLVQGSQGDLASAPAGSSQTVSVSMGIAGSLQVAQSVSDPLYTMRFDGTGSQNQSVSCTTASGSSAFFDTLASGCAGSYGVSSTFTCPGAGTVITCVSPATGNKQNQVAEGLNQRILGSATPSSCTAPNHWSSFPDLPAGDPRIVTVFVTPYGSFGGSGGSSQFPIENFAAFYITGWQDNGNGFSNPCQGNGDDTAAGGTVVGHFIKYVNTDNVGGGGTKLCSSTSLGECVAVLTR